MSEPDSAGQREKLIEQTARVLVTAFDDYNAGFGDISRRARRRYLGLDRAGMRADSNARYDLYEQSVAETLSRVEQVVGERLFSISLWRDFHIEYARCISGRVDEALYKTFFNSLSRRLFRTRGVDTRLEFLAGGMRPTRARGNPCPRTAVSGRTALEPVLAGVLEQCELGPAMACSRRDASRAAGHIMEQLDGCCPTSLGFLDTVFYREGRAFLVGSIGLDDGLLPCVIVLVNGEQSGEQGIRVDAILTTVRSVSILFGFTHSYFLADLPAVEEAVAFLHSILPGKSAAELYTVLGRVKQGKTERYRHFFAHLAGHPDKRLVHADGQRGLVMLVFTLPGYPLVFKVIRDRFAPSKQFGRRHVMDKYRMVFRHDRVGRLVDTQQFKRLGFPSDQFDPELLDELETRCARSVNRSGRTLIIRHCYVQQRLRPLDMFLREVGPERADQAAIDYGQAVLDLACCNLFAGDLLLKNFGVTRNRRAIFYDYDELALLTDCRFRTLPDAPAPELELAGEDSFTINPGDVFPEQFHRFMGLPPDRLRRLRSALPELFDIRWWRQTQERIRSGDLPDVPPYAPAARLDRETPS